MRKLFLILTLVSAHAQDIFVPFFESGGNNLKTSLLAYWGMDTASGTVPNATLDTTKDLTIPAGAVAPTVEASTIIGNARAFDQTDVTTPPPHHYPNGQYLACTDAASFNFGSTPFTIVAWVFFQANRTGDHISTKTIISKGDGIGTAPTGLSWSLYMARGSAFGLGQFGFYASKDGSTQVFCPAPATPGIDIYESGHYWMVMVTWNGSTITVRARDETLPTTTYSNSVAFAGPFFTTNDPTTVACNRGSFNDLWGSVDSIGIWNRVLDYPCQFDKLFAQSASHAPTYAQFDLNPCQ
jgi:hypothetical protein